MSRSPTLSKATVWETRLGRLGVFLLVPSVGTLVWLAGSIPEGGTVKWTPLFPWSLGVGFVGAALVGIAMGMRQVRIRASRQSLPPEQRNIVERWFHQ